MPLLTRITKFLTFLFIAFTGFYTAPGWDPVTGFGSVNFEQFSFDLNGYVASYQSKISDNGKSSLFSNKYMPGKQL